MLGFARRFPDVGLALSLHSARQDERERLIPLAKHNPLPQLRAAVGELNRIQSRPVMCEYLLLDGITDTAVDLQALLAWTEGLRVHINLIPYNPTDVAPDLKASKEAAAGAFEAGLKAAGRKTTVRYSLGRDIQAACGQLVRREGLARRGAR